MNRIKMASLAVCPTDKNMDTTLAAVAQIVDEACISQMDLLCLPEIFAWVVFDAQEKKQMAESVDGPVCSHIAFLAQKYSVYILAPILEREREHIFNTAVLFDRKGKIAGKYRKVCLPDYELEQGIRPGDPGFECFQTEFGPVGCAICFDLNYHEIITRIHNQGCKLILVPTMFQGVFLMRTWAQLYGIYFVSSAAYPYAAAIDPLGRVIVAPWDHGRIMQLGINLDYVILHTDHNEEIIRSVKYAYRDEVVIDSADQESCAILSSLHPTKTADMIAQEFKIEAMHDYLERARRMCNAHLYNGVIRKGNAL